MESVKILLVLCLILKCNCWVNEYDGPILYECPRGQSFAEISSEHADYYRDRQWNFQCANTGVLTPSSPCRWAYHVNGYGKTMKVICPRGAITGIRSYYRKYNDRIFSVKCCKVTKPSNSCKFTKYVNAFNGKLEYYIPSQKYLNGIYSIFSHQRGDRRFQFSECDLPK